MKGTSQIEQTQIQPKSLSITSSFRFFIQSAYKEVQRRPCGFCLAFFSVLIVVLSISVSQTNIDNAPLIFLKTAEGSAAERDIKITSSFSSYLNFTQIEKLIPEKSSSMSPRLEFSGTRAFSDALGDCKPAAQKPLSEYKYEELKALENCTYIESTISIIDTNREKSMGLGRDYTLPPLEEGECYIHDKLADKLNLKKGDILPLGISMYSFVRGNVQKYNTETGQNYYVNGIYPFYIPFKIKDTFFAANGKYPDGSVDTTIIIEYAHFNRHIPNYMGELTPAFQDFLRNSNPYSFAQEVIVNIPNRMSVYVDPNYDKIQNHVTKIASDVVLKLGVKAVNLELPVLSELYPLRLGAMFMGVLLNTIIFVLFLLSVLLLYSLLLVSVETKTFELGVSRVLGLNKIGIFFLIITQALTFSIPAIICGICLSFIALSITGNMLKKAIGADLSFLPSPTAATYAILMGLLVPLISSLHPIMQALEQNLSDILNTTRSKTSAIKIQIVSITKSQFSPSLITFSIIAIMFGVSIYYLLPLALLSFDLALLISIFFWILIGLLLGFVLLSLNMQYLVERFVVFVFLFWAKSATKTLVLKNLVAHRLRNRRTGIMFSMSIAFVIFLIVAFTMELKSQSYSIRQKKGVYLELSSKTYQFNYLDYEKFLRDDLSKYVESVSFITDDLKSYMLSKGVKDVLLSNYGELYFLQGLIIGVTPNLFTNTFQEFLQENKRSNSGLTATEELYTARGSEGMIVGTAYADKLAINSVGKDDIMTIGVYNGTYTQKYNIRVSAIIDSAPALKLSKLPQVTSQSVVVSMSLFQRMARNSVANHQELPVRRVLIKERAGLTGEDKNELFSQVSNYVYNKGDSGGVDIWDFRDYEGNLKKSESIVMIIFISVMVVAMFLSFFSLASSMTANIFEQVKEIAVMRALGVNKRGVILLFVYEAFVLVLANSLMGLTIGCIVGFTMSLQRVLFTQLPISFEFPWVYVIVIFIVSFITAFLSTFLPARRVMSKSISDISRITS